jgi:hypothetical protein
MEMPPRRSTTAPLPADDEATLLGGREAQALAGRHRQARADASEHQRIAGQASGAKRQAVALPKADAAAKKAAHKREVRARAKAVREEQQALAASFAERLFYIPWDESESAGLGFITATWFDGDFEEMEGDAFKAWLSSQPEHAARAAAQERGFVLAVAAGG